MANNFTITISAVDRATASIRKVNQSIERITKPITQLKTSMGALGKEMGLERVNKSMGNVARAAGEVGSKIRGIVAPLAAITGFASVMGIARLSSQWGSLGMRLTNTADNIGMSVERLQSLRGAARHTGVAAEALDAGLQGLGTTLQDAVTGRNMEAANVLRALHIQLGRTANGTLDTTKAFLDLANVIANVKDAGTQRKIASEFGLEQLLPLMRKGKAGIEQLEAKVRSLGGVMSRDQVAAASKFEDSMMGLTDSMNGLKYSIGDALIPVMKPMIEGMARWVAKNKELIATRVAEFARRLGDWLMRIDWDKTVDGVFRLTDKIITLVDNLGGLKVIAWAVAGAMTLGLATSITGLIVNLGTLTTVTIPAALIALKKLGAAKAAAGAGEAAAAGEGAAAGGAISGMAAWGSKLLPWLRGIGGLAMMLHSENLNTDEDEHMRKVREHYARKKAIGYFTSQGWSPEQAAGIVANLSRESGLNSTARGDNGKAYGIAQWHPDRQAAFAKWVGKDIRKASLDEQLRFVQYELTRGNEKNAGDLLRQASDAQQAGAIVSRFYERPLDTNGEATRRAASAMEIAQDKSLYANDKTAQAGSGNLHVDVHVHAPSGTKASVKSRGDNANHTSRVVYAMQDPS